MVRTSMRLEGDADMDKRLRRLSHLDQESVAIPALLEGGEVIAELARTIVPVQTGNLRDSIAVSTEATGMNFAGAGVSKGGFEVYVGPAQGRHQEHDGFYGHMVEFGTAHSAAEPFMRPAFDEGEDEARSVIAARLKREFDRLAKG